VVAGRDPAALAGAYDHPGVSAELINAVSPGVIDTGIWDSLGEDGKRAYFEHFRTHNPARRIGTVDDVAEAVLFAMTNEFLTGTTVRVDGGEPLT
jgi:NAD(P)-dependent dehydrogenase (short-subunit alcohol dehydrogenase family)